MRLMWEHPYTDCVCPMPSGGELDLMWTSFVFPWGVLLALPLVEGAAGDGGAGAGARYGAGQPFCSVTFTALTALVGTESDPKLLEQRS